MDIINSGADFCAEIVFFQHVEYGEVGTACFKGDDICVHIIDFSDNVRKFAVAHMSVYLRFGLHTAVDKAECRYRPIKIIAFPVGLSQRQLFTESRFIYLNDAYAVGFKVEYLLTYSMSYLEFIRTAVSSILS